MATRIVPEAVIATTTAERVQITWNFVVRVWHSDGAWHRRCADCGAVGKVFDARGAFEFISRPDWVCADCRPHREAIALSHAACLRKARGGR